MIKLLNLTKQIIMCTIILRSINGQEFMPIPSRGGETLVSSSKSELTNHRDHKHGNHRPTDAELRSESYERFPNHESDHQNYPRHSNERFHTARLIPTFPVEKEITVENGHPDRPAPLSFDELNRHKKKHNGMFEVLDKPVIKNCENSSDIVKNMSIKNNTKVNSVSNTTFKSVNITDVKDISVDDRASFDGAQCPTGLVKVQGKCIPQD